MKKIVLLLSLFLITVTPWVSAQQVPAFPGAEGFGRYTTGGRGGAVYHITSLEDDVHPTEGMLRYAIQQQGARTLVFDVAGTIHLKAALAIKEGNLTIAGQTAPGDGICIADFPVTMNANNIILRYLRFRLGNLYVDKHEGDALGSMNADNLIVDHCSISWSVDECCSVYAGKNLTVQWCIISQSMNNCGHSKGEHGYGGNWGGSGCTYAHNLLCHHVSRTPRLGPSVNTQLDERLDLRNNVIYNWGGNGCYGGEGMNVNIVNNYYKPGPATEKIPQTIQQRIAAPGIRTTAYCHNKFGILNRWYPMWHVWGKYYVDGNVNSRYEEVTRDNWTYGVYNQITNETNDSTYTQETRDTIRIYQPIPYPETTTFSAEECYQRVLDYAGCIKIRNNRLVRDYIDSVMINDTKEGKATYGVDGIIATQADVTDASHPNPWPELKATKKEIQRASKDSNQDGIPDYYEKLYGFKLPGNEYEQSQEYTNLELYLNRLVDEKITKGCLK